jgi:hypothetical protein
MIKRAFLSTLFLVVSAQAAVVTTSLETPFTDKVLGQHLHSNGVGPAGGASLHPHPGHHTTQPHRPSRPYRSDHGEHLGCSDRRGAVYRHAVCGFWRLPSPGHIHHTRGVFLPDQPPVISAVARLYVDGVEVTPGTPTPVPIAINTPLPTNQNFYIGAYRGTCELRFNGDIDEVRIFNRALSAPEIQNILVGTP